jgi:putative transposase
MEAKQRDKIGKLTAALARKRREELHLIVNDLLDGYKTICVEDFDIKQMTRSAKGTTDQPGEGVARKRELNRRILEKAWGEFAEILEYKAAERGAQIIRVDPKYLSRECPECGVVLDHNPSEQTRVFHCRACRHVQDVDEVAARNALTRGLAELSRPRRAKTRARIKPRGALARPSGSQTS